MKLRKYKFKIVVQGDNSFAKETYIEKYYLDDEKLKSQDHLEQLVFSANHYLKQHSFPSVSVKVYTDLGWLAFTITTKDDFTYHTHHHVCDFCRVPTLYFSDKEHNCTAKTDYYELRDNYEYYFDDPV